MLEFILYIAWVIAIGMQVYGITRVYKHGSSRSTALWDLQWGIATWVLIIAMSIVEHGIINAIIAAVLLVVFTTLNYRYYRRF